MLLIERRVGGREAQAEKRYADDAHRIVNIKKLCSARAARYFLNISAPKSMKANISVERPEAACVSTHQ